MRRYFVIIILCFTFLESNAQINLNFLYPEFIPEKFNYIYKNNNIIALAGDYGNFLISQNSGINFQQKNANIAENFRVLDKISSNSYAFAASNKIYTTTNNGINWNLIRTSDKTITSLICITSVKWLYTSDDKIFFSSDAGLSWNDISPSNDLYYDYLIAPDSLNVFISGRNKITSYTSVFRSTNSGINWTRYDTYIDDIIFVKISFLNSLGIALCSRFSKPVIMKSSDFGNTWFESPFINFLPDQICLDVLISSPSQYTAATNKAIYKTTNSGSNWSVFSFVQNISSIRFIDSDTLLIADYSGKLIKFHNNNLSNDTLIGKNNTALVEILRCSLWNIIIKSNNKYIFRSSDYGNHWLRDSAMESYDLEKIFFVDENNAYAIKNRNTILKSVNSGQNWSVTAQLNAVLTDLYFVNINTGWAVSEEGFFRTTNQGINWSLISNLQYINKINFFDSNTGYALSSNSLYSTINSGQNWVMVKNGVNGFSFLNRNTGWVFSSVDTNTYISSTTNSGNSWNQTSVVNDHIIKIKPVNQNMLYMLSLDGIYRSTNSALSWKKYKFPVSENIPVYDFDISGSDTLFFCGNNGLIFRINNSGTIWTQNNYNTVEDYNLLSYPNPFNSQTIISYSLKSNDNIKIDLYDLSGRQIKNIFYGYDSAGEHKLILNSNSLASGIYFLQMKTANYIKTIKIVLLK